MVHDLTGQRFGRLVALRDVGRNKTSRVLWLCQCDCGNEITLSSNRLLHPQGTKSCGCLRREVSSQKATKHGHAGERIYKIWSDMKKRCNNPNHKNYNHYGGRGIIVCEAWNDFPAFYEDMHPTYKEGLTIDRRDNNGNYEPGNCRWITPQEQLHNYSRNVFITINGETDTVLHMCEKHNANYDRVVREIKKGMPPDKALKKYKINS